MRLRRSRPRARRASVASLAGSALAVGVLAASGCDFHGAPLVIEPEFDDVSSFETSLEKWTPRSMDLGTPPAAWEIARSGERAEQGTQSARLRLANGTGQAKIFLERRYEVERNQRYRVEIAFGLGSADGSGVTPWRVVAGAAPESPAASGVVSAPGDTGTGRADPAYAWVRRSFSTEVGSDEEGELFVSVGLWATSSEVRTYYVDVVEVTLTRLGITTTR